MKSVLSHLALGVCVFSIAESGSADVQVQDQAGSYEINCVGNLCTAGGSGAGGGGGTDCILPNCLISTGLNSGTKTNTRTETATRTETKTSTSSSTNTNTDNKSNETKLDITRLSDLGNTSINSGLEKIAFGIVALSQAGGDAEASQEALKEIGAGKQEVAAGQTSLASARNLQENSEKLASLKTGHAQSTPSILPFSSANLSSSTQEAITKMESIAGVSGASLVDSAKSGNTDSIYGLVASANGVTMSESELASQIPVYQIYPASEARPTDSAHPTLPIPSSKAETVRLAAQSGKEVKADTKLVQKKAAPNEKLSPLEADSFLASLSLKSGGNQLGDSSDNLFQRVRRQYVRRRGMGKAK